MRRLRIDFVRPARAVPWLGWCALALALGVAGLQIDAFRRMQLEVARLEDRAVRLRARDTRLAGDDVRGARARREELLRARAVSQQLTLPWGRLFEAVERAAEREVALIALHPESAQGLVRITAEAKDLNEALEFVRRLAATRQLRGVHLASHQLQAEDARRPVRFVVVAVLEQEPAS